MKKTITCFDVALLVIEEANKQFAPLWIVNSEKLQTFTLYCDVINELSQKLKSESFLIEVDEITMNIQITLECPNTVHACLDILYFQARNPYFKCHISVSTDQKIETKFSFPGIWERSPEREVLLHGII